MASWVSGFKPSSKSKTSSGARARAAAKSRSSGGSNSSGGSSSTVPHDFVGPLRPGTVREAAPIQGPTRPGTDVQTFRKTGRVTPSRSPSPSQAQIAAAQAAEEVRQAELQRKQAEAKKLADEVKSVKLAKIDSQKIGGQVNLKDNTATNQNYGTIQNYGVKNAPSNIQVYTEPTIEKRTTGSFVDVNTGKNIPTSSYFLIELQLMEVVVELLKKLK